MTEMFEVSPLSPVREWAMARSSCGISALHDMDGGGHQVLGQQGRADSDDLTCRLRHPTAARRAVEVERLHFIANARRLSQAVSPPDHADPHLAWFRRVSRVFRPEDGVHTDEVEPKLIRTHASHAKALGDDLKRQ